MAQPVLPRREREILELVRAGHTSSEIAQRLGLSPRTVDSAVHRARLRFGASTRIQAAIVATVDNDGADHLAAPRFAIDDELRALVDRLRDGGTIAGAAADIGLSRRTASRRLAELRLLVGTGSTARAVVVVAEAV